VVGSAKIAVLTRDGKEFVGDGDPAVELSADMRSTLVNEDPVTCCSYFDKLANTIMNLLKSKRCSPFGRYRVVDFYRRTEFQQRGSPNAHTLVWLDNDPNETVDENMPNTIRLIDELCSVDPHLSQRPKDQTHRHTFTWYKKAKGQQNRK